MNNWPCNWKCVPLPAHKPRLNRFCPDISFLGACAKSINYVLLLTNLSTTDPALGHVCHYRPQAPSEQVLPRYLLINYVLLLTNLCTTDPAIGSLCHYLPTSPVWTGFAQKSPSWGLVQNQSSTYQSFCQQWIWRLGTKWMHVCLTQVVGDRIISLRIAL